MVMIEENKYMDGYLEKNLILMKKAVLEDNWDFIAYCCGYEGVGKTTLATQICYYLDPTFCIDRVVFTGEQFKEACIKATKGQAILFDEAYWTFNNKNMYNNITKMVISMLTMVRKKNLFIIIVSPTFFDLQKYLVVHRSRFMIYVYAPELKRGRFALYNRDRKMSLYVKGRKDNNMYVVKPNFIGRFVVWKGKSIIDEEAYDKKKDEAIAGFIKNDSSRVKSENELKKLYEFAETRILTWLSNENWLKRGVFKDLGLNYYKNVTGSAITKRIMAFKENSFRNNELEKLGEND